MEYTYKKTLEALGLSGEQAKIYEIMVKKGPMPASAIARNTDITRPLTYKVLDQLEELGLVEKNDTRGKITFFFPLHPSKLHELLEKKERSLEIIEQELQGVVGQMSSDFNLFSGKPNVQFYEGEDGVKKVAQDALTTTGEILSITDNEKVKEQYPELNQWFIKNRVGHDIPKKIIYPKHATPTITKDSPSHTQYKKLDLDASFSAVMQMYDNKVSFITLNEDRSIGVIIEDSAISEMLKTLFSYMWEKSDRISDLPDA